MLDLPRLLAFLAAAEPPDAESAVEVLHQNTPWLEQILMIVGSLVVAVLALLLTRRILLRLIHSVIGKTRTEWDDKLREARVFDRLSYLAPGIVIHVAAFWVFPGQSPWIDVVHRLTLAWMTLTAALVVGAVIDGALAIYRSYDIAREFPLRTLAQVIRGAIYFVAFVLILALVFDKEVWGFFTGIGALTAVIMLVFKDTILGFVASIQLSLNRMVRRGDWIEMPHIWRRW